MIRRLWMEQHVITGERKRLDTAIYILRQRSDSYISNTLKDTECLTASELFAPKESAFRTAWFNGYIVESNASRKLSLTTVHARQ